MEVDKGSIPESVLKDDQHTMGYYQALPYAHLLDGEAETWLNEICTNLAISVQARDFAPGAASWVKRLSSYINMKHAIPRETRAKLAELLYSMTFMPGMDTALMDTWASTCCRLIRKAKHLGPEDLVLPWRPLYDAIEWYLFHEDRAKILLADTKHVSSLIRLLECAQRFFPASATQEILDELLPQFTTSSIGNALRVVGYLVLMLPTHVPRSSQTHAILDDTAMHPKEFVPTLFSIWSMITNSPTCDAQFVDLIARVAEQNIMDSYTNEIGMFDKQQVKYMFTVGMRMMNLPVGSRENGNSRPSGSTGYGSAGQKVDLRAGNALVLRRKPERFKSLAKFIVYTMVPEGSNGESYVMTLLSEMIQATELYYHPSNHGTWTYCLTTFIQHLAVEFLKRWRTEEEEDCPTPQERRLTPELRKQFVLTLRPLTYLSMFGKDHYVIGATEATLKALAWLEPGLIFPGLLERIYPSLETLTETHRTTSALGILADVALPLFSRDHYPAGGKHLMPLLHLATPGVDMNDPLKAITSLMFITSALSTVPIRDLTMSGSGSFSGGYTDFRYDGMDMDNVNEENELPREEEDRLCKATTGELEEWVAKFLRRVFTIFENLPQIHQQKKQNGSTETGLTSMLEYSCDTLFGQLSEDLYDMALRMVIDFVSQQVLPNAIHAAGLLCGSIACANPAKAAKRLIPLCINNISSELEHGAASTMINAETSTPIQSDSTLHWYQCILFHVVIKLGPDLIHYKSDIINILNEMITKCKSRRGFIWSAALLKNCLGTLLKTYARDRRSLNPEDWHNEELMNNSHMLWGKPADPKNLKIDWHVPSDQEKAFAIELLETFLVPAINHVRQKIETADQGQSGNAYEEANDFCRHLAVIYYALRGSTCMCLDEEVKNRPMTESDGSDDEGSDSVPPVRRIYAGYAFTDPSDPNYIKAQKIRKDIGELIRDCLEFFLVKREDDLESLKLVIDIARAYMDDAGVGKKFASAEKGQYLYAKAVIKVPKAPKQYPRGLLVRRAEIHHFQRLRYNAQARTRGPIHEAIFKNLLGLSLSSYAEIRKLSQHTLSATAKNFIGSKSLIIPTILEILKSKAENGDDKEQHANRVKGSLYLLRHRSILMPCLRDWRYIPTFILSLVGTEHEDKPSIQDMIRKVFVDYVSQYNTRTFHVIAPEDFDTKVQAVYPASPIVVGNRDSKDNEVQTRVSHLQEKVQKRLEMHLGAYQQLMRSLLEFVNDPKVHWRYLTMAANFIELFIRPDMPQDAGVAAFASQCMLSELPTMRRIGVGLATNMMYHMEHRSFAQGDPDTIISRTVKHPLKQEFLVANNNPVLSEEEYLRVYDLPLTDENLQQWPLIDSERMGWYAWPKKYDAYVLPSATSAPMPEIHQSDLGAYKEFHKSFTSKEFWDKLQKYMAQEVTRAHEDMFNQANVFLYMSAFRLYEDEPIAIMKENLVSLCQASDQKAHQRAAAEIAAGIIRASVNWPIDKTDAMWSWLIPLLETTFANITPDTLIYWESFVRSVSSNRDPRRVRPLINLILGARVDPTSDAAFAEARKLILANVLISALHWRANPLVDRLLTEYMSHIDHPYKQVREVLGGNISGILQRQWIPSQPDVQTLLSNNAKAGRGAVGNIPTQMGDKVAPHVEQLLNKLDQWQTEAKGATEVEDTKIYTNASKTTLCWLLQSLGRFRVAGTLPYIIPLWSRLFAMQEFHDDQDLQQLATRVLGMVAQYSYPPSIVVEMVNEFVGILTRSESWRIRTRALPLLQIFFFKNLFLMESDHVLQVMNSVSDMMLDSQIEVRQMAAVTLGGLVRCSQREAISKVQEQYSTLLQIKLPKRRRDRDTGKIIEMPGFADALLKKHAGVLGLSCLVSAFPYEVPKWMPDVLCQLANCMSDPAEIQSTIRKTFSDFRRTHSDTWHEDMSKFTEDQLSILSDMLISPSYYA